MMHELGLTSEQQAKAKPIFERHRAAVEAVMKEDFPKIREAREQMDKELQALLTTDQLKKLESMRERGRRPRPFGMDHPPEGLPPPPDSAPPPPQ